MTTNTYPHAQAAKIRIRCECGARGKVSARHAGRRISCSRCGAALRVPGGERPARPAPGEARLGRPARPALGEERQARPARSARRVQGEEREARRPRRARSSAEQRIAPAKRAPAYERDELMDAHIASIGLWNRALGLLGLIGGGMMIAGGAALGGTALLAGLVYFALAAGLWALGHGLVSFKGWARALTGASAGLSILLGAAGVAQGTTAPLVFLAAGGWNAAILWALFSPRAAEAFTPQAAAARGEERVRYWISPFCWAPLALAVLVVALR